MTEHEDPDRLADELEHEADRLAQRSAELGDEISDVGEEWQRKRADEGVPGAPAPAGDEDPSGDADREAQDAGDEN